MSGREEIQSAFLPGFWLLAFGFWLLASALSRQARHVDPGGVQSLLACRSVGERHTTVIAGEMKSAEADDNAASSSKVIRVHPSPPVSRYHVLTEGENDLT